MAASGQIDWTPDREGAKGAGYTVWTGGKQYVDTVFKRLRPMMISSVPNVPTLVNYPVGWGEDIRRRKGNGVAVWRDEYEPQLQTLDIKRSSDRESGACADLAMRLDTDLFYTGENQQFIQWGKDAGATRRAYRLHWRCDLTLKAQNAPITSVTY